MNFTEMLSAMKILLIEDSFFWQKTIQNCLEEAQLPSAYVVSSIPDAIDYLENTTPDLIIADIMVKKQVVFEVFKTSHVLTIPTIFITSSDDERLYELKPRLEHSIYMIKPIHPISLRSAVEHLLKSVPAIAEATSRSIIVKGKYNERIPLSVSDIICVRAEKNYCIIKTQKVHFLNRTSLAKLHEELGDDFVQVHRAFLVNIHKVEEVNLRKLFIKTSITEIPIGLKYHENALGLIKKQYEIT